jgi:hypothetical protein
MGGGAQPLSLGVAGPACLNLAMVGEASTDLMLHPQAYEVVEFDRAT